MDYLLQYVLELNLKEEFILFRLASCSGLSVICLALFSFGNEKVRKRLKSEGFFGKKSES